jgi:hypothetical protein
MRHNEDAFSRGSLSPGFSFSSPGRQVAVELGITGGLPAEHCVHEWLKSLLYA